MLHRDRPILLWKSEQRVGGVAGAVGGGGRAGPARNAPSKCTNWAFTSVGMLGGASDWLKARQVRNCNSFRSLLQSHRKCGRDRLGRHWRALLADTGRPDSARWATLKIEAGRVAIGVPQNEEEEGWGPGNGGSVTAASARQLARDTPGRLKSCSNFLEGHLEDPAWQVHRMAGHKGNPECPGRMPTGNLPDS